MRVQPRIVLPSVRTGGVRFLLLTQYFPPEVGAAQARLGALTREVRRAGHSVEVLTALPNYPEGTIQPDYRGRFYVKELVDGVTVHRVWLLPAMGLGPRRMLSYTSFAAASLAGAARVRRPDVVLVESPPLTLVPTAALLASRWGVPLIMNVADLWPDAIRDLGALRDGPLYAMADRLERWSYRRAALVTTVTDGLRHALVTRKGVPDEKVVMLPNGVDTTLFTPREPDTSLAREFGLPETTPIILYAGTHGEAHGLEIALDAAERVGDAALFLLVGSGSAKPRLVADASRRGLANVRFLDPMPPERLARLYGNAYAALSTLRPTPLLESARPAKIFAAMAAAKPVVYSGGGEGAELVRRADAGLVTPAGDAAALAEAISRLIDDRELAASLGEHGRAFVVREFEWSVLVRRWLDEVQERLAIL